MPTDLERGKRAATAHEKRLAALLGGRRVHGSGALGAPGDVRTDRYLVQCKYTEQATLRINFSDLRQIASEARDEALSPAMAFELASMPPDCDRDWVLVPLRALMSLMNAQAEHDANDADDRHDNSTQRGNGER